MATQTRTAAAAGAGTVLLALAAGQFLMALDSSVMNVSIATVADDLGTTVTGIQTAIVLYTLVMAMLMVTGGKIGSIIGRKRAFMLGLVIYCSGSLTTALSPNLGVLILGWSFLEGVGAALIMPAIVVKTIAITSTSRKFTWIPARLTALPPTRMWMPSSLLTYAKWPDANQPTVNAPIAKNAT